jgi:hypothetical protein
MSEQGNMEIGFWAHNLEEIDREIGRLARICDVKIVERQALERVLHKDASVCGTSNPLAFAKLHDMLMVHLAVQQKASDAVGTAATQAMIGNIVERLRNDSTASTQPNSQMRQQP